MLQIAREMPDPDDLLALSAEELGKRLLFAAKERVKSGENQGMIHPQNWTTEPWVATPPLYPIAKQDQVKLALTEAWEWLKQERFIVPAGGTNGQYGWCVLSRKAEELKDETGLSVLLAARRPAREILHPKIVKAWPKLQRGELNEAVSEAMLAVEVAVREAAGFSNSDIGVKLIRKAFDADDGPLTDKTAEAGEREAVGHLFAGTIGIYKNPRSHRHVPLDDPNEAVEILMLASNLLRIVERASSRCS